VCQRFCCCVDYQMPFIHSSIETFRELNAQNCQDQCAFQTFETSGLPNLSFQRFQTFTYFHLNKTNTNKTKNIDASNIVPKSLNLKDRTKKSIFDLDANMASKMRAPPPISADCTISKIWSSWCYLVTALVVDSVHK